MWPKISSRKTFEIINSFIKRHFQIHKAYHSTFDNFRVCRKESYQWIWNQDSRVWPILISSFFSCRHFVFSWEKFIAVLPLDEYRSSQYSVRILKCRRNSLLQIFSLNFELWVFFSNYWYSYFYLQLHAFCIIWIDIVNYVKYLSVSWLSIPCHTCWNTI